MRTVIQSSGTCAPDRGGRAPLLFVLLCLVPLHFVPRLCSRECGVGL